MDRREIEERERAEREREREKERLRREREERYVFSNFFHLLLKDVIFPSLTEMQHSILKIFCEFICCIFPAVAI